jgi:hypothetical protein
MSTMIKRRSDEAFFKEPRVPKKRGPGGFPIGPRTIARQKANAELRKDTRGDKRCELGPVLREMAGVNVCSGYATEWAHATKSRHITTKKDWKRAAHSCRSCHDYVEPLGKKMAVYVDAAIARRPKPPKE